MYSIIPFKIFQFHIFLKSIYSPQNIDVKKYLYPLLLVFTLFFYFPLCANETINFEIEKPEIVLGNLESNVKLNFKETLNDSLKGEIENSLKIEGIDFLKKWEGNILIISFKAESSFTLKISNKSLVEKVKINVIPLWLSILPPLLAILMALLLKEVISSLFIGIFSGTLIIHIYNDGITGIITAFLTAFDKYIINSLNNKDHLSVIIFSMMIGGTVTIISKNGGMQGVVNKISRFANNAKNGQLVTWFLGVLIFFDDYANTLIVGNTMRPVTDRLKISREKLSYLVDSTAAPIAAIAFVTTWIGAELGYIADSIDTIPDLNENAYTIFISSLQFAFYPIFTLVFMLMLIIMNRDFGPMLKAENRSRTTGLVSADGNDNIESVAEEVKSLEIKEGLMPNWINAALPIFLIISVTMFGLVYTGWDDAVWHNAELGFIKKISTIIGQSNSYQSLIWGSGIGLASALLISFFKKLLSVSEGMHAMMNGFKTMLSAIMILLLAWTLASIAEDLHTADFITQSMLQLNLNPILIPAITFILAAIVAFSTGSSWGTMAILYPLMLPASWMLSKEAGLNFEESLAIFHNVTSCVLAGAVLGDHCSPISDTTILSSLASSCNHLDHVKTQMPYALTVGAVAVFIGTLPSAMGLPPIVAFLLGFLVLWGIVKFFGKKVAI